jgi:hypothetical protein
MVVLTGSAGVFSHYPNGYMWTGSGEREVVKYVGFSKPFNGKPSVSASLAMVDSSNGANLRVNVSVQDVTNDGFNVRVATWGDTKLAGVSISWIAVRG